MQNVGIVAEFNPFHNGHKYLIDSVKRNGGRIICVMSGNYVQRGDTAITDKFSRAEMAVKCGADLVVELPTPWAMSTAQNFAFGAVGLLNSLGIIDTIAFGSECGNFSLLKQTADILKSTDFNDKINKEISSSSKTFAAARSEIFDRDYSELSPILKGANDTLATEYILAAERVGFCGDFLPIKRIGAAHDSRIDDTTVSASFIREKIKNGQAFNLEKYMPSIAADVLKNAPISDISRIETAILCKLREIFAKDTLPSLPDLSEGIENRIKSAVKAATTLEQLYSNIKTKRYTLARIRRICLSAFLNIDNSYFGSPVPYIRVLAMGEHGEEIIRKASKSSALPIVTKLNGLNLDDAFTRKCWECETLATDLYALSLNKPLGCGEEYYKKIIKT